MADSLLWLLAPVVGLLWVFTRRISLLDRVFGVLVKLWGVALVGSLWLQTWVPGITRQIKFGSWKALAPKVLWVALPFVVAGYLVYAVKIRDRTTALDRSDSDAVTN